VGSGGVSWRIRVAFLEEERRGWLGEQEEEDRGRQQDNLGRLRKPVGG
jgi:hypothetical protein